MLRKWVVTDTLAGKERNLWKAYRFTQRGADFTASWMNALMLPSSRRAGFQLIVRKRRPDEC